MDLRGQEIKNTYGNVVTIGSSAGSPTTGELTNGQNSSFTSTYLGGNFGIGSAPTTYGSLNVLALGSAGSAAGGIIDIVGTSGRLASIYTEASGKLVFTADPTNGEAGTSMEFNVDGSNAMFIDSSRNVGIGTTSPSGKLHVAGGDIYIGASYALKYNSTSYITPENNVSGAEVSTAGVFVVKTGLTPAERMRITSAGDVQLVGNKYLYANPSAGSTTIGSGFNLDGSNNLMTLWTNDTERMRIDSGGNVAIGTSSTSASTSVKLMISTASGGFAGFGFGSNSGGAIGSPVDGTLALYTASGSIGAETYSERMRIVSSGNVGIGTSSPSAKLHVYSGEAIIATNTDGLKLSYSAGNSSGIVDTAFSDNNLEFRTNGTTKMWIANAGNVGIGTTTPETKLDVDGDIQTAAPETSTNAAWKLGNVGLGGVEVGPIDYITVSVGGFVVKLPIAIFPETQAFYDRVIADGGTFEGLLGYESAVTILKAQ